MKAIIPIAGNGTRLYPATKVIKKPLLPILDIDGKLKPALLIILEQLEQVQEIDEIILVIGQNDYSYYDNLFPIESITKPITYVIQDKQLGLGHAVSLCAPLIENNFLLILGDMICKSNSNINCYQQIINKYKEFQKSIISLREMSLEETVYNGVGYGNIKEDIIFLNRFYEKPNLDIASKLKLNDGKYYGVFGNYILDKKIFDLIDLNNFEKNEIQLSTSLDILSQKNELIGFVADGKSFDLGQSHTYINSIINYSK